jgi:hypothetical protein
MLYRVQPVRLGFAVVLEHGMGVSRMVAVRDTAEDAERICGDLNRFAALFARIEAIGRSVAHGKA